MKIDLKNLKGSSAGNQSGKKAKKRDFYAEVRGKKCFSFDFGTYSTKLTIAKVSPGNVQVLQQILIENREHSRTIESDNLNDWRAKISKALEENNINPAGQIGICAINSTHYIARQFDLPLVDDADLEGLSAYELGQSLELDMEEHIFQHKVLRTYENRGRTMCTVWAAAVPKSLCQNYFDLLASLKLKPLCLDLHVNGLENLLEADRSLAARSQNRTVAMIDYGLRSTEMYILKNGLCVQTSNIDSGEGKLIAAAKNALGAQIVDIHNSNKVMVPPQQIYEIIRDAKSSEVAAVFADVVQKWISEINNVIRRFNIDHPGEQIGQVFIYGGSQQLPWLKAYLENLISIPVEVISDSSCFRYDYASDEFPKYLNSAAVLLRRNDENDCNFFGSFTASKGAATKIPTGRIVLLFGVLLAACALIYGFQAFRTFMMKEQLAYLKELRASEALNTNYSSTLELEKMIDKLKTEEEFMTRLIANVEQSNTANIDLLKVIGRCVGEEAMVREIEVETSTIKLEVEMDGKGSEEDVQKITDIERRFRETGYFGNVLIEKISNDDPMKFNFTLVLGGGAIYEE